MFNYDYIPQEYLQNLLNYKYTGIDKSLLYNYVFSPFANLSLKAVPESVAPNILTLLGFLCIVLPHILFIAVMGNELSGNVPNWLLWLTVVLHLLYMVWLFINVELRQHGWQIGQKDKYCAQSIDNTTPLGMILDHNIDSMIIVVQGINLTTAMQFGHTLQSYILYCIPAIPFYVIALEQYHTDVMKLPIINAASEGTLSVAVILAITAMSGCDMWLQVYMGLRINEIVMLVFTIMVLITLPFVFNNISKVGKVKEAIQQCGYLGLICFILGYWISYSPTNVGSTHMRYFMYTIGLSMSNAVGIVALHHVARMPLPGYLNTIYLYIAAYLNILNYQVFGVMMVDERILIIIMTVATLVIHVHFLYNTTRQITKTLGIKLFENMKQA